MHCIISFYYLLGPQVKPSERIVVWEDALSHEQIFELEKIELYRHQFPA
jgi:hypothetical protein